MKSDIIARRELEKDGRKYEVRIERPYQSEQQYWVCEWSVVDDSQEPVFTRCMPGGVDSVQALLSVLLYIDVILTAELGQFTFLEFEGPAFPVLLDLDNPGGPSWFLPQYQYAGVDLLSSPFGGETHE